MELLTTLLRYELLQYPGLQTIRFYEFNNICQIDNFYNKSSSHCHLPLYRKGRKRKEVLPKTNLTAVPGEIQDSWSTGKGGE